MWDAIYHFIYGYYPYVAVVVFVFGTWRRFRTGQFGWKSKSSQLLRRRELMIGSNFFHAGVIVILVGHLLGFLTPHSVLTSVGITARQHLIVALVLGGAAGISCFIGLTLLIHRRLFDPRIRRTSSAMDIYILLHLYVQLILGLATIPISLQHLDGMQLVQLGHYFQHLVILQGDAISYLAGVHWIVHLHLFFGLTLILVFPFTRLVHMLSLPLSYIGRSYILVRSKRRQRAA